MHDELVDAIAWWRVGISGGRRVLVDAATDALVAGIESDALAELAGLPGDENPFAVDALVERVAADLGLEGALSEDIDISAARHLSRAVLRGEVSERELTRWVHEQFSHASSSDLIRRLAEVDDEYDAAEYGYGTADVSDLTARARELAARLVHPE